MLLGLLLGAALVAPLVLGYFLVIKGADRYEPEPIWLLIVMFLWGVVGAIGLGMVGGCLGDKAVQSALGAGEQDPSVKMIGGAVVAPLVEESAKGLGVLALFFVSIFWLHEMNGPLDGVIYGGMAGLGFTLTEDVLYVAGATAEKGVEAGMLLVVVRTVLDGLGHSTYTALTGLGFGAAVEARNPLLRLGAPVLGWMGAVVLHGTHNLLAGLGAGGCLAALGISWIEDLLFFVLLFALAWRDRGIVLRGLRDEVGTLLDARELASATSGRMFLPLWNYCQLSAGGFSAYRERRAKQLALVDLAFVKARRARGDGGETLDRRESELRAAIGGLSAQGIVAAPA